MAPRIEPNRPDALNSSMVRSVNATARRPPVSDPARPRRRVPRMPMGSRPGTTRRATARAGRDEPARPETEEKRAERVARGVARQNPDPTTRREAIEQELAEENLSKEGSALGQHNE